MYLYSQSLDGGKVAERFGADVLNVIVMQVPGKTAHQLFIRELGASGAGPGRGVVAHTSLPGFRTEARPAARPPRRCERPALRRHGADDGRRGVGRKGGKERERIGWVELLAVGGEA